MADSSRERAVLIQVGILLLVSGIAGLIAFFATSGRDMLEDLPEGEISVAAALQRTPSPLWIDARSEAEYQSEHIFDAISLNEENWSQVASKVIEGWEPGRTAVVYCDSPGLQASREVAERLRDFKLGPVFVLHGGWKAWKQK